MKNKQQRLVCGVGLNDLTLKSNEEVYSKWADMLRRCYDPKTHIKHPTYNGCTVCSDWLTFSNFKKWYDINNRVGMHMDKDILIRGNKIYGPEYCRFVPQAINKLLNDHGAKRGQYPQGVYFHKPTQKYIAKVKRGNGSNRHIGYYLTEQEAFNAYKIKKELWIKNRADWYYRIGLIGLDIHSSLHNWVI